MSNLGETCRVHRSACYCLAVARGPHVVDMSRGAVQPLMHSPAAVEIFGGATREEGKSCHMHVTACHWSPRDILTCQIVAPLPAVICSVPANCLTAGARAASHCDKARACT